jgi:hypothetical protein
MAAGLQRPPGHWRFDLRWPFVRTTALGSHSGRRRAVWSHRFCLNAASISALGMFWPKLIGVKTVAAFLSRVAYRWSSFKRALSDLTEISKPLSRNSVVLQKKLVTGVSLFRLKNT